MKRIYAAALCGLFLAAAQAQGAAPAPKSPALEAPTCGARIFVIMGVNRNYPERENMRVPRGDFYIDGVRVTAVSKDLEIAALDVPAGPVTLSWVPSSYDDDTRRQTKQNALTLTLTDTATAFVALDWYDDTPRSKTIGYRTEVVETRDTAAFAGKRIAFRRPLKTPCAGEMTAAPASSSAPIPEPAPIPAPPPEAAAPPAVPTPPLPSPPVPAPSTPTLAIPKPRAPDSLPALVPAPAPQPAIPPAPAPDLKSDPGPQPELPDVSDSFMASLQMYYVVNARGGAPAFPLPTAEGSPLYTFPDGTELKVAAVSADKRWLTVLLPGNKTGYVSSAIVTSGVRAPK